MNWYSTYCKLSCTAWYCAGLFPSRQYDVCVDASSYMHYTYCINKLGYRCVIVGDSRDQKSKGRSEQRLAILDKSFVLQNRLDSICH